MVHRRTKTALGSRFTERPVPLSCEHHRTLQPLALAVAALFGALSAWADGGAPCPYSVTQAGESPNCGFWGYSILQPQGLNNLGHWVGYRNKCPDNESAYLDALRWTPANGLETLPVPPLTTSAAAYGINDMGTVVGAREGTTNGQSHFYWACIWLNNGEFVEIPPLGGGSPASIATAVNNAGTVVGWRTVTGGRYAFAWQDGTITDLHPADYGFATAEARDIADSGYVVGQFGSDSTGTGRGFRWKGGVVEILEPLPGAITSDAQGVNNAGITAGLCRFQSGSIITYRATTWGTDGVATELPTLPGYSSWGCFAVNDAVMVLGTVSKPTQPGLPASQYVVWLGGVPYAVKSLISTPDQISTAWALNQLGQIGCRSLASPCCGAVILTPIGSLADLNEDCVVDGSDLSLLLQAWGNAMDAAADLNHDGKVDGVDLGILLGAWTGGG